MSDLDRRLHDARAPLATIAVELENLRTVRDRLLDTDPESAHRLQASVDNIQRLLDRTSKGIEQIAMEETPDEESHARSVLVVDDEPALLRAISRRLGRKHLITTADSVAGAIEALDRYPEIAAIVLDVHLGDGGEAWDLLSWMRDHRPELVSKTVGMTGGPVREADTRRFPQLSWARKPDDMPRIGWFVDKVLGD